MEGWSDEKCLLRHDKYSSNIYSSNHSNHPGSSSNKDMHHKRIRMMGAQKYLRESCYHHIECTATNFLTAFILRRPLNSVVLTTTTYRKPERVSNKTDNQVRAQMINKCRIKMAQRELYNVRDPPWGGDQRNRERTL